MTNAAKTNPYTNNPAPVHPAIAALARNAGARPLDPNAIRCSQPQCQHQIDPGEGKSAAFRQSFAMAHGFVESEGRLFCSKRCYQIEQQSPSGLLDPIPLPKKVAPTAICGVRISTTTLRDVDGTGATDWAHCAYPGCQTKIEIPPGEDRELAAVKAATAHGFVETPSGVYCGGGCARKHHAEIAQHVVREVPRASEAKPAPSIFEAFRDKVRAATLNRADGVDLVRGPGNMVALIGSGRAAAFEADTLDAGCTHALAKVEDFCAGRVGAATSPFVALVPMRVGALSR